MLRISVSDTGPGIPKEMQHELFEPFRRLGNEGLTIEGTGIGLTITKHLVELMNGEIGFESTAGVGSCFWVDLPLAEESESAEVQNDTSPNNTKNPDLPNRSGNIQTVLYVEDDPSSIALMKQALEKLPKLSLITVATAEEGLTLATQKQPHLILLDINLPGMDGISAIKELKQNASTTGIPVIAVTANAMPSQIQQGIAAGFNSYLTKPFEIPKLLTTIEKTIADHCSEQNSTTMD